MNAMDANTNKYTVEQQRLIDYDSNYLKLGKIATCLIFGLFIVFHILIDLFGLTTIIVNNPWIVLLLFLGYFAMWTFFVKYLSIFDIPYIHFWFVIYVIAFFLNYAYMAFFGYDAFPHFSYYKIAIWFFCIASNLMIGIKLLKNEADFIGDLAFMGILFLLMALSITVFAVCETYYLTTLLHKKITILNYFYEYQELAVLFNLLITIVQFVWLLRIFSLALKWKENEIF